MYTKEINFGVKFQTAPKRLFPFSPLITRFEKKEFRKAVIYYHKTDSIREFASVDSLLDCVERFHGLRLKSKVKIFLTESDKEYTQVTGSRARFVTMPGGRIFISNHAKDDYR